MKIRNVLLVCMLIALLLSACAPGAQPSGGAQPAGGEKFRVAVVMPSAINDMAFSQSMYQALKSVQQQMGEANFEIKYSENMFDVPKATAAIRDYASQGFNLIIAHGSQYKPAVQEIAKEFPKVAFAWGTDVDTFGLPNVSAYTAAAEEGCYVNGVMAAKLTQGQEDRRDRPGGSGRCQDLHRRLHAGCGGHGSRCGGQQDLDRLVLGRGEDDGSGQGPHRGGRGRADRFFAIGSRIDRCGEGSR